MYHNTMYNVSSFTNTKISSNFYMIQNTWVTSNKRVDVFYKEHNKHVTHCNSNIKKHLLATHLFQ